MKNLILLAAVTLIPLTSAQALETYTCSANSLSSVIPTTVIVEINGTEVSGKFDFNSDRSFATFGQDRSKNDFSLVFTDTATNNKTIRFSQDGWDHYAYTMTFNDQAGVLVQDMQLDCSDAVQAQVYMTCSKK